jgi:trans-aconitate 2-methyltransferase
MAGERPHMARDEWDAGVYHRVSRPQLEWGDAVLRTVPLSGSELVVDLGCGSGRLTRRLAERVPRGLVVAVDRSWNMLREARRDWDRPPPRVFFVQGDAARLPLAGCADLIFSTATFHWVLDQDALFRSLFVALRPGGLLVAQCGGGPNLQRLNARADRLMRSAAFEPWFRDWSEPWRFENAEATALRLTAAGFVGITTSVTPAPTSMPDRERYLEFIEAVIVRPHLLHLPETPLRRAFLEALADQAAQDAPPFELDYWRLNIRAKKPA